MEFGRPSTPESEPELKPTAQSGSTCADSDSDSPPASPTCTLDALPLANAQAVSFEAVLQELSPGVEMGLKAVLQAIAASVVDIAESLRVGDASTDVVGTQNKFGDEQLEVDIKSDKAVFSQLRASGHCAVGSSEESPEEIRLADAPEDKTMYSVAFDPLDGSSIVDANFAVGSIFGIWPGVGFHGRTGAEQVAAAMAMYGPRTTLALAVTQPTRKTVELTLTGPPEQMRWELTKTFAIKKEGKTFAPGNLRATADHPLYMALVQQWLAERYTLRYTGGMVPDVYHILTKGKGIFCNATSPTAKAKLRLLYECAPIALIVECAGGASTVAPMPDASDFPVAQSVLDVRIDELDQRLGVSYGSEVEVQKFKEAMWPSTTTMQSEPHNVGSAHDEWRERELRPLLNRRLNSHSV